MCEIHPTPLLLIVIKRGGLRETSPLVWGSILPRGTTASPATLSGSLSLLKEFHAVDFADILEASLYQLLASPTVLAVAEWGLV